MQIYNTHDPEKGRIRAASHEGKVGIYACGPTVYNYFHIGNARPFIVFDALRRYLEYRGYDVTFVQNFTDIDDKMIKPRQRRGHHRRGDWPSASSRNTSRTPRRWACARATVHPTRHRAHPGRSSR